MYKYTALLSLSPVTKTTQRNLQVEETMMHKEWKKYLHAAI